MKQVAVTFNSEINYNNNKKITMIIYENNTTNSTTNVLAIKPFSMPDEVKTFLVVGYSLLFVLGVIGNCVVIAVTYRKHKKKSIAYNLLIISLALADLLGSIFAPVVMISHLESLSWSFIGSIGCKIFTSFNLLGSLASAWTIVAIALTRSCILKNSTVKQRQRSTTKCLYIIMAWLISILVTMPYTVNVQIDHHECRINWSREENFICSVVFLSFVSVIPITILCWAHLTSINNFRNSSDKASAVFGFKRAKQVQKITKLFSMITITFFVLTTPYSCFYLVLAYSKMARVQITNPQLYTYLYHGLYLLSCVNFVVNPYFYAQNIRLESIVKRTVKVIRRFNKNGGEESGGSNVDVTGKASGGKRNVFIKHIELQTMVNGQEGYV